MKLKIEIIIAFSFLLGLLYGYFQMPYNYILQNVVSIFIKIFVFTAPFIIFVIIFFSASILMVKGELTYGIGARILFSVLFFSYISSILGFLLYLLIFHHYGITIPSVNIINLLSIVIPKILVNPIMISIFVSLSLPYILKYQLPKYNLKIENINRKVIGFFKKVTYLMPIITFSLGASLYFDIKSTTIYLMFYSLLLVILLGFLLFFILSSLVSYVYKENIFRVLKYTFKAFISTLPLGGSYLSLPMNLRVFSEEFGESWLADLALSAGASINRCGSVGGALIALYLSSVYTGNPISYNNMIILSIVMPLISLGAPGLYGGTLMVATPIISNLLGLSPESALLSASLAIFISIMTYIQAAINTTTNGYIGIMLLKNKSGRKFV